MKTLNLNFSRYDERQRLRNRFVVLMFILLVLAFVFSEVLGQREQLNEQALLQPSTNQVSKPRASLTEQEIRQNRLIQTLVSDLNTPWFEMLAAIELVKQQNPDVFLTELEPNVKKGEVAIGGEVQTLPQLLAFVDALNQQPVFYQALLVNQRQLDNSDGKIGFSLKVGWHSHE